MVRLRALELADLEQVVAIHNADPVLYKVSVEQFVDDFATLPPHLAHRLTVAESEGEVVGWVDLQNDAGAYHPQKFMLHLGVPLAFRRRGIGGALFQAALEQARALDGLSLRVQVRDDDAGSLAFARARGFEVTKTDFASTLDLASFSWPDVALPGGVRIGMLAEVDSPEVRRAMHDAFSVIRLDTPRSEPPTPISFEFFEEHIAGNKDLLQLATPLALQGDTVVGFTGCFRTEDEGIAEQWLTGVRREHRGQGLALALKLACIRALQGLGYTKLMTDNDTRNAPMLAVNTKLGFVRGKAVHSMVCELASVRPESSP